MASTLRLRACLHGGGGPKQVRLDEAGHPTYYENVIKLE